MLTWRPLFIAFHFMLFHFRDFWDSFLYFTHCMSLLRLVGACFFSYLMWTLSPSFLYLYFCIFPHFPVAHVGFFPGVEVPALFSVFYGCWGVFPTTATTSPAMYIRLPCHSAVHLCLKFLPWWHILGVDSRCKHGTNASCNPSNFISVF